MIKPSSSHAGGGGVVLDLGMAASPSFSADQRVEAKICELCGKGFFRGALSMYRDCDDCRRRSDKIATERLTTPVEAFVPRRGMKRARQLADHALSLRPSA
jgi:hypothetical protein